MQNLGFKYFKWFHIFEKILDSRVSNIYPKDVGDDNWALFYTFSSDVSEKPGFRNN